MTILVDTPLRFKPTMPATSQSRLLVFQLGQQAYAIPIDDLQEIVPMAQLSRPPGSPALLAGLLDMGGTLVPVIHLSQLFNLPLPSLRAYTPILILRTVDHPLGLLAQTASRIASMPAKAILTVPDNQSFNGCATGLLHIDGKPVLLLSAEKILLSEEREHLRDMTLMEQLRRGAVLKEGLPEGQP